MKFKVGDRVTPNKDFANCSYWKNKCLIEGFNRNGIYIVEFLPNRKLIKLENIAYAYFHESNFMLAPLTAKKIKIDELLN
jgi:hypothetical protein